MHNIKLTKQEVENLLSFLTGKSRIQLTGDESFEFVKIVNKIATSEEVKDIDDSHEDSILE